RVVPGRLGGRRGSDEYGGLYFRCRQDGIGGDRGGRDDGVCRATDGWRFSLAVVVRIEADQEGAVTVDDLVAARDVVLVHRRRENEADKPAGEAGAVHCLDRGGVCLGDETRPPELLGPGVVGDAPADLAGSRPGGVGRVVYAHG